MFDPILQSLAAYFHDRPPIPIFDILIPMMQFFQLDKCLEGVYTHLFKRLLGVNRSVTNAMIRAELRRHSLIEQVTTANLS